MSSPDEYSRESSIEFINKTAETEDSDDEQNNSEIDKYPSNFKKFDTIVGSIMKRKTASVRSRFEMLRKSRISDSNSQASDSNSDQVSPRPRFKKLYKMNIFLICGTEIWDRNTNKNSISSCIKIKQLGKTIKKSKVIPRNINPVWCQLVELKLYDLNSDLEFIVFDSEHLKALEIARGSLCLKDFEIGVTQEATIKLGQVVNSKVSETMNNGTVLIKFTITSLEVKNDECSLDETFSISPHKTTKILAADARSLNARFASTISRPKYPELEVDPVYSSETLSWPQDFWELASFYPIRENNISYGNGYISVTIISASNVYLEVHKKGASGLWTLETNNTSYSSKNGLPNPFITIQIGSIKKNTKSISNTRNPVWNSSFDLKITHDTDPMIHFSLWHDSGSEQVGLGIASIDVSKLPFDLTRKLKIPFMNMNKFQTYLTVLITLTGLSDCVYCSSMKRGTFDADNLSLLLSSGYDFHSKDFKTVEKESIKRISTHYSLVKSHESIHDVGWFNIQILSSQNIPNGEYYCSVQLPNYMARTKTYKNHATIEWKKSFIMPIKDINALVTISIIEDKDEPEVLGRISIPLMKLQNGKTVGYRFIENRKSTIVFKANVVFNPIRAGLVTFGPKEIDYLDQEKYLKINQVEQYYQRIKKNANRVLRFYDNFNDAKRSLEFLISWDQPIQSIFALIFFQTIVWFGQLYMIPIFFLVCIWSFPFLKTFSELYDPEKNETINGEFDQDKEDNKKKNFNEFCKSFQKNTFLFDEFLHNTSSLFERITMMFSWESPWLTNIFTIILIFAALLLYVFPFRLIASIYGFKKFLQGMFEKNSDFPVSAGNFIRRYPCLIDLEKQRRIELK